MKRFISPHYDILQLQGYILIKYCLSLITIDIKTNINQQCSFGQIRICVVIHVIQVHMYFHIVLQLDDLASLLLLM